MKKRLLLHICCGPCAAYPIEYLKAIYHLHLVFYGPNIHPLAEYQKRLEAARALAERLSLGLTELPADSSVWFAQSAQWPDEPEGGKRCLLCHQLRLREVVRFAKKENFSIYATTLTISPHKQAAAINALGQELAQREKIQFLAADFKEKNGFNKGCRLTRQYGLYRQNYCGCVYSQRTGGGRK